MNRITTFLTLLLFIASFAGCNKDDENSFTTDNSYCSKSKFQILINEEIFPITHIEDHNSNIIILGIDSQNKLQILKLDTAGNIIWKKERPNSNREGLRLICLDDNSLIITSNGERKSTIIDFGWNNVYVQNGYRPNCELSFELGSPIGYSLESKNYLTKLDKNGNLIWEKEFDGMNGVGNCLLNISTTGFAYLTIDLKGKLPTVIYDENGVFQDTVLFLQDQNIISFYKMDAEGNIITQKEIPNIFNSTFDSPSPVIDLLLFDNHFVIKSKAEIICLDLNGNIAKSYEPIPGCCDNSLFNMYGNMSTMIVSGVKENFLTGLPVQRYTHRTNLNNDILWELDEFHEIRDFNYQRLILGYYNMADQSTHVYDIDGQFLWSLDGIPSKCSKMNCNGGVTAVQYDSQGIIVTRTDANGKFD